MKDVLIYIILISPFVTLASSINHIVTHQISNLIIIGEDTLYAAQYFYGNSSIHDFIEENSVVDYDSEIDCKLTSCYRDYFVIWQLIERDLFLKEIVNCCTLESISMDLIFGEKYNKGKGIHAQFINGEFLITDTHITEY